MEYQDLLYISMDLLLVFKDIFFCTNLFFFLQTKVLLPKEGALLEPVHAIWLVCMHASKNFFFLVFK